MAVTPKIWRGCAIQPSSGIKNGMMYTAVCPLFYFKDFFSEKAMRSSLVSTKLAINLAIKVRGINSRRFF